MKARFGFLNYSQKLEFKFYNTERKLKNRFEIILSGICAFENQQKNFEIEGREKMSFEKFLGSQNSKNVDLGKVLGIGGEGVVIQEELEITLMEADDERVLLTYDQAENIVCKSTEKKVVALKFVNFEKEDGEDFQGHGLSNRPNFKIKIKY